MSKDKKIGLWLCIVSAVLYIGFCWYVRVELGKMCKNMELVVDSMRTELEHKQCK